MSIFVSDQQVLFVDDDEVVRAANVQSLELAGIKVAQFGRAEAALVGLDADFAGIVVTDIRMPRMDGLQFFARLREIDPEIPVILITGHADVPTAVAALHDGAFDFLAKPFAADHLTASVQRALATRRLVLENRRLREAAANEGPSPLIGDSPAIRRLRETIAQVAGADIDVLVEGETGTGKELAAILLHRQGPRRGRPFVPINCAALPDALAEVELFGEAGAKPGRIEASGGGTLFLDDVETMPPHVQARMLRVLEEREVVPVGADRPTLVNLRVIAAAKQDLALAAESGRFRQDLFFRLNVVRLRLPPLRERRADIPLLFAHFVAAAQEQVGGSTFKMTDWVRRRLLEHDWPGNVRELRNFAFQAVLAVPQAAVASLDRPAPLPGRVQLFEATVIRDALVACRGDIKAVLDLLGIPRKTLYDKFARHGIDPADFRPRSRRPAASSAPSPAKELPNEA